MIDAMYFMYLEQEGISKEGLLAWREIDKLAKEFNTSKADTDKEYIFNILNRSSCIGQEEGFVMGFKCAVRLLANCFE